LAQARTRCPYDIDLTKECSGRASYATRICAGSDGENATRQVVRIATARRLSPVADQLIVCTRAQMAETILAQDHQCGWLETLRRGGVNAGGGACDGRLLEGSAALPARLVIGLACLVFPPYSMVAEYAREVMPWSEIRFSSFIKTGRRSICPEQ
jgi:hypothetical protein